MFFTLVVKKYDKRGKARKKERLIYFSPVSDIHVHVHA